MARDGHSALRLAVTCFISGLVLPVGAASAGLASEQFRILPRQEPYTTKTFFDSESEYEFEVSGTIVETDEHGNQSTLSAYHCLSGLACQPPGEEGQNFMVHDRLGAELSIPGFTPALTASAEYKFVTRGHAGDQLTFAPIPFRRGELDPVSYSGEGFTFKVRELPGTREALFSFKIAGFPDRPDEKHLPDDLVDVELETSKTVLTRRSGTERTTGSGTIRMTTSYLGRATDVRERTVRFEVRESQSAQYKLDGSSRSVFVPAEVTRSQDRNCPVGAKVHFFLSGGRGHEPFFAIGQEAGPDCLGRRSLRWNQRRKFKKARIGFFVSTD